MSVRMTNFAPVYPFDPATGTPHGTAFSETAQLDKGAHPGQAACKPLTNVLTAGLHIIFVFHHHPRDRGDGRLSQLPRFKLGSLTFKRTNILADIIKQEESPELLEADQYFDTTFLNEAAAMKVIDSATRSAER